MSEGETSAAGETPAKTPVRVWDLPVRLFHWLLVAAVVTSLATGMTGGLWQMELHVASGIFILGLVLFRIIWGFVGGRHARFAGFVKGPLAVIAYVGAFLARREGHGAGHNPLGGWSVVAILLTLAALAGTGLFSNDDIFIEAPLFSLVGKDTSDTLTGIHEAVGNVLIALVVLHLAAITAHYLRGDNLVKPMVTGTKPGIDPAEGDDRRRPVAFVAAALLAATIVWGILRLG